MSGKTIKHLKGLYAVHMPRSLSFICALKRAERPQRGGSNAASELCFLTEVSASFITLL
jgi:hypothetical protein